MVITKLVIQYSPKLIEETEKLKNRLTDIYDQIRRQGGEITKNQQEEINEIMEEMKILQKLIQ